MPESVDTGITLGPSRRRRHFVRRFIYPAVVLAAIAGAIWWLDYRDDGGHSTTGEKYGPVELPSALIPAGASIAAEQGALAPDFLLEGLDEGQELRLSDFRGHPVVLNFWATWCRPCRQEMPQFVKAYDKRKDQGLVIIAVNLQEGRGIVGPYARDFGMDFPIGIDRDGEVGDRYRLLGLPTTYFIGRDGVITSVYTGPFQEAGEGGNVQGAIDETELDRRIAEIMAD